MRFTHTALTGQCLLHYQLQLSDAIFIFFSSNCHRMESTWLWDIKCSEGYIYSVKNRSGEGSLSQEREEEKLTLDSDMPWCLPTLEGSIFKIWDTAYDGSKIKIDRMNQWTNLDVSSWPIELMKSQEELLNFSAGQIWVESTPMQRNWRSDSFWFPIFLYQLTNFHLVVVGHIKVLGWMDWRRRLYAFTKVRRLPLDYTMSLLR